MFYINSNHYLLIANFGLVISLIIEHMQSRVIAISRVIALRQGLLAKPGSKNHIIVLAS